MDTIVSLRLCLVSILALHKCLLVDGKSMLDAYIHAPAGKLHPFPTSHLYVILAVAEVPVVIKTPRNRSDRSEGSEYSSGRVDELDLTLGRLNGCRAGTHG